MDRIEQSQLACCSPLSRPGSALTDVNRGGETGSSSQSQCSDDDQSSRINLLLQDSESLTRDQINVVELSIAVLHQDIVRARKLAKKLEGIDIDELWREVAQIEASKSPEVEMLAGPLHHAAQSAYKPMCKLLITQCRCDVNASTIDSCMTPLMFALHHEGNKAIVKYLINNHADPNKGANSGIAPLHIAATEGYYEIVEYLLSRGADVDPLSQDGESPLFCAVFHGHERIVTLLLKHGADAGADINGAGCSVPPVALAAYKGLDGCIQCLLRNGANPNVPDEDNNIPIQIAAFKGWEKCVEILLPHAPHLPQYEGLSISEIIHWERTERFRRSSSAIEQGDVAYWKKEHDIALRFYNEAAQVGHEVATLYAKKSLCYLHLRDPAKFIDEAINYINMVQPDLSTLNPESDAKKLVLEFGRTWKAPGSSSRQDSGSSPTNKTGETSSSREHQ
ncbi:ankyrin repeat and protein kinase domain-containing protein 1 isoform X4 [Zea mays]|uniref:ankyrin repeat and protein kinase domain-containing protein 1 isoform X4 n=1 Tax=Zea mays TaxID=4577 RepID=UPI0004DE845D|nr:ankyrin repeat and protein kinase domain-containing protein 1 isoform X4 [Zea mays]|eukprot:XP_008678526.1 ankyrin repeat and protein kinase domain-containing protein 1 isoform X4 [Zea mays]